jgi:hypothetical protein
LWKRFISGREVDSPIRTARRRLSFGARSEDRHVREWQDAWTKGARARWSGGEPAGNPHQAGSRRAAAWVAGWQWAEQQPDRRQSQTVRFAHPYRRRDDTNSILLRSAQAGAVGLSALTALGWLWQSRRRRASRRAEKH